MTIICFQAEDGIRDIGVTGVQTCALPISDPVDPDVVDQARAGAAGQRLAGLVLDDVGQRAGRRGQRHVQDRHVGLGVDVDAVDQAQVDDVDAELGVDDVAHGLLDVLEQRGLAAVEAVLDGGVVGHRVAPRSADSARALASFSAIQLISAHLTRAGYLDTPANAMASSSWSSSSSASAGSPLLCISSMNCSPVCSASGTLLPSTRSYMADTEAWLIEQPMPS